ncbi:MAG: hypothetical protein Udaeo2_20670 [Candidatus Udaeobacter sp.]|nr:MAG: hypothetical protein Udaeo2_20670 [Candidatus Udaeobacter sp.]
MLIVENDECREERWYKFIPTPFLYCKKRKKPSANRLSYRGAVKRHLLSDVPVGAFL